MRAIGVPHRGQGLPARPYTRFGTPCQVSDTLARSSVRAVMTMRSSCSRVSAVTWTNGFTRVANSVSDFQILPIPASAV